MIRNKNIVLIGFMGCGKTTVGEILAKETGYSFIDTDNKIEHNEGMDIPMIFKSKGEQYFRRSESIALRQAMNEKDRVVSTGGGIVIVDDNKQALREGIVVYLKAGPEHVYNNVKNDTSRPLLREEDVYAKICTLLKDREIFYEAVAHYTVQVDGKTPKEICNLILNCIK